MAEENDQEKTEEPTQQRREDFRKRGQVAQTKELASALFLFTAVAMLYFISPLFLSSLTDIFRMSFGEGLVAVAREGDWVNLARFAGLKMVLMITPLMAVLLVISFVSGAVQVGFLYNEEALQFKPDRLNPAEGFKRLFSLRSVVEGIKAMLKVSCVGLIVWLVLKDEVGKIPELQSFSVEQVMAYLGMITIKIVASVAFFVAVIAGIDFLYQKYELEKKMMMSRQEVKEEMKSRE
ncbi:MAG: EscU/YscU/HrcU family type III secretion system export apparatus switch protein, partial [Pseudomonadota bacterium]